MALEYVVTKRVFGFDDTKTEKYVAKSVRSGQMSFSKTCAKVSRLCGVHRKVVDLVVSGLVDMMAEDIDDGKSVQLGEFGIFRPTIKAKSADTAEGVTASNIDRKFTVIIGNCPQSRISLNSDINTNNRFSCFIYYNALHLTILLHNSRFICDRNTGCTNFREKGA